MKKTILLSAAFALALSFGAYTTGVVNAADSGPAEITLKPEGKKPVKFPHKKHQDMMDCATCHKDGAKLNSSEWNIKTGHATCLDCHKKGHNGKNGPTKCNDCHTK